MRRKTRGERDGKRFRFPGMRRKLCLSAARRLSSVWFAGGSGKAYSLMEPVCQKSGGGAGGGLSSRNSLSSGRLRHSFILRRTSASDLLA